MGNENIEKLRLIKERLQMEAELARMRAELKAIKAKRANMGKKPEKRMRAIEFAKAAVAAGCPHTSEMIGVLAKYFAPKKQGEDKGAWESRVNELVKEMGV